jgi:hypothetical protein
MKELTTEQAKKEVFACTKLPNITWRQIASVHIGTMSVEEKLWIDIYLASFYGFELTKNTKTEDMDKLLMKQILNN